MLEFKPWLYPGQLSELDQVTSSPWASVSSCVWCMCHGVWEYGSTWPMWRSWRCAWHPAKDQIHVDEKIKWQHGFSALRDSLITRREASPPPPPVPPPDPMLALHHCVSARAGGFSKHLRREHSGSGNYTLESSWELTFSSTSFSSPLRPPELLFLSEKTHFSSLS